MSKRPNDRKGEIPQDRVAERTPSIISDAARHGGSDTAAEQRQSQTVMELLERGLVDDALVLCERLAREYSPLAATIIGTNGCLLMPLGTALNDFVDLWKLRFTSGDGLTQDRMRKLAPWLYGQGVAPLSELPRDPGNPATVLMTQEPVAKPQPDRGAVVAAAMASLWRAMLALPTGHPALRSLQKCEDATAEEAVRILKMSAAALRLMHLNASAEHVERAMELLSELHPAAT